MKAMSISSAIAVIACLGPAATAQVHAPAGGAWANGHFYKGGQFMPAGGFMSPGPYAGPVFGGGLGTYDVPAPRLQARVKARTAARTEYRGSARKTAGSAASGDDQVAEKVAQSRLNMARSLIGMGKAKEAREWLNKVVEMQASPETVVEAKKLLSGLKG